MARLSNSQKRQVKSLIDQISRAFSNGRYNTCEQLCAKIEALQPGHPDATNMRGIICYQTGQMAEAEKYFVAAIRAAPKRAAFHNNLGKLYSDRALYEEALKCYKVALNLEPDSIYAQTGCGNCLLKLGDAEQALPILEVARKCNPGHPDLLLGLFAANYKLGRLKEARGHLEALLEHCPNHAEGRLEMGKLLIQEGRKAEGEAEVQKSIAIKPGLYDAHVALAYTRKHSDINDPHIVQLESLYKQAPPDSPERVRLGFAMGKVMENLGQYDRAFEYFNDANDIRYRHGTYHQDQTLAHLQAIMKTYTPEVFEQTSGRDDDTPIFIVGMPRCGSTLVEQILASHPDVCGKGESGFFATLLAEAGGNGGPLTLEQMVSLSPEQWHTLGGQYLERLKNGVVGALRITDKSLGNIRMIGAIHCALPKAKIVHVRRHPLDTCLSIYKNELLGQQHEYGRNLEQLGYYYRMYLKLMQHWRDILPAGVMYELDYEQLVAHQKDETRKLLDACGLSWNEQCLQFHRLENVVNTASLYQVRNPIYTDSLALWAHYEKQLQPLIRILRMECGI